MGRLGIFLWLAACVLCVGCSVLEDRESCPCRLVLDFSGVDTALVKTAELVMKSSDGGFVYAEKLDAEGFVNGFEVLVPRDVIVVMIWSGADGMVSDDGLRIPYGEDCPPVYFHASAVAADSECHVEKVVMRKNHCRMTVEVEGFLSERLAVAGNVCGYAADGKPVAGDFRVEADGRGWTVVLPRQTDEALALEVMDGTGVLKRFNLGGYIAEGGYDWSEPDLKDLTLYIDVSVTQVRLLIGDWEKVLLFDMII